MGGGFTALRFCHPRSDTYLLFIILQCDKCPWTLTRGVLLSAGQYSLDAGLCLGEDRAWWGTAWLCILCPMKVHQTEVHSTPVSDGGTGSDAPEEKPRVLDKDERVKLGGWATRLPPDLEPGGQSET